MQRHRRPDEVHIHSKRVSNAVKSLLVFAETQTLLRCLNFLFDGQIALDISTHGRVDDGASQKFETQWQQAISKASRTGVITTSYEHMSSRNLAEELLNGCRAILTVSFEKIQTKHILWKEIQEFFGAGSPSQLTILLRLRQDADSRLYAEIINIFTGHAIDVKLNSLIDAFRGIRCDAIFADSGGHTCERWIDPSLGHPAVVNGISYKKFMEWASEPSPEDTSIRISTIHSHDTQLASEPGLNPILAPIGGFCSLFQSMR